MTLKAIHQFLLISSIINNFKLMTDSFYLDQLKPTTKFFLLTGTLNYMYLIINYTYLTEKKKKIIKMF